MAKCVDDLIKAAGGAVTRKEAQEIIAEIERRFNRKMPKEKPVTKFPSKRDYEKAKAEGRDPTALSPEERMVEAATEAFAEAVQLKKEKLRRQELQIEKQVIRQTQLMRLGGNVKAVESMLVDPQGELTLQGRIRSTREGYLARLAEPMDNLAADPEWRRLDPVVRETLLAEALLNDTASVDKNHKGPITRTAIEELAYAFRTMDNDAYHRKNAAGADIHYTPGHVPQMWNPSAVRLFGLSAADKARLVVATEATRKALVTKAQARWVEYVLPRIDPARYVDQNTGAPLMDEELREVLSGIWRTIASNGLTGEPSVGQAALATQLGARREVWFLDAQGFVEANREFGARDLFSALTGEAVRHAREIALLETYGPNPAMGFKTDLAWSMGNQAEVNPGAGRKGSHRAQIIFDELSGKGMGAPEDRAAVDSLAKYDLVSRSMKGLRNLIVSAKLGMLPFSQINDLATFRAMARADGLGTGKTIKSALSMFNPANVADRKLARRHGILSQMVLGDAALRYGGDTGSGQGWTSQLANATVKWSGAQHWTDSLKQAYQVNIGWHLAEARHLAFDALPKDFGAMVRRYGITADEWEVIRRAETVEIAGEQTVTPHTVARAQTPDLLRPELGGGKRLRGVESAEQIKIREAALKVGAMMAEEADIAILQPGAKEKAIASGGTLEGTISGELMRSAFFFKTFSVAMLTKALPRIAESGQGLGKVRVMTEFMLLNMVAGAMTIQLKEIVKGRNPRDMEEPEFWASAFMQAGGLGIFGDFFFADQNRFGGGLAESAAGPVAGFFADLQRLTVGNMQQAADGKDPRFVAEAIQFGKNYTPLMNLWYTRLALDHAIFFHVQEAANPGYLRRSRRRIEKGNQSFWWSPDDNLPEGPPDLSQAFGGD
jgi:hypothetical protein